MEKVLQEKEGLQIRQLTSSKITLELQSDPIQIQFMQ